jgi:hypothetical protein
MEGHFKYRPALMLSNLAKKEWKLKQISKIPRVSLALALLSLLLISVSCGLSEQPHIQTPSVPGLLSFSLTVLPPSQPVDTSVQSSETTASNFDVKAVVKLLGFHIVDKIGKPNVPGEGHLVFYSDAYPRTTPNVSVMLSSPVPGTSYASLSDYFVFSNVQPGNHLYAVQLVNNDDTPLNPPLLAEIETNLSSSPGAVSPSLLEISLIVRPPSNASKPGPSFDAAVFVQIAGFKMPAEINLKDLTNVQGAGHIIFYGNVEPPTTPNYLAIPGGVVDGVYNSVTSPFVWQNDTPGYYVKAAQLVNNDFTSLAPPVYAKIKTYLSPDLVIPEPTVSP